MAKPGRPGASKKKGGRAGTGGNGRQALEGKGPTPKAEDRKGHKASFLPLLQRPPAPQAQAAITVSA